MVSSSIGQLYCYSASYLLIYNKWIKFLYFKEQLYRCVFLINSCTKNCQYNYTVTLSNLILCMSCTKRFLCRNFLVPSVSCSENVLYQGYLELRISCTKNVSCFKCVSYSVTILVICGPHYVISSFILQMLFYSYNLLISEYLQYLQD